jgi:membrane fusion protein, multidrug efflux system
METAMKPAPLLNAHSGLLAAVGTLLLTACSQPVAPPAAARPVYVTTVAPAGASDARNFTASVRARVETELAFRTGGKVVQRLVDVGAAVRAGQPLAQLDAGDLALAAQAADDQVRAAQVDAEQAASDEARFRRLAAEGSVGSADHERQKARADVAAARLDQAQRQLALARNRDGYTTLRAPYDGIVTALRAELGQVVAEGQPVLALARSGECEIVADIPEDWVGRVRSAAASARGGSAADAQSLPAWVPVQLRELSPLAAAQGRTYRVRFAATAPSREALSRLPLGSTAQLQLVARGASGEGGDRGVLVPVTALIKGSGAAGVWVINPAGNGLVFTPVQVQAIDDNTLRVTGLTAGQRVVSVGAHKLDATLAVRAVERPGAALAEPIGRTGS